MPWSSAAAEQILYSVVAEDSGHEPQFLWVRSPGVASLGLPCSQDEDAGGVRSLKAGRLGWGWGALPRPPSPVAVGRGLSSSPGGPLRGAAQEAGQLASHRECLRAHVTFAASSPRCRAIPSAVFQRHTDKPSAREGVPKGHPGDGLPLPRRRPPQCGTQRLLVCGDDNGHRAGRRPRAQDDLGWRRE